VAGKAKLDVPIDSYVFEINYENVHDEIDIVYVNAANKKKIDTIYDILHNYGVVDSQITIIDFRIQEHRTSFDKTEGFEFLFSINFVVTKITLAEELVRDLSKSGIKSIQLKSKINRFEDKYKKDLLKYAYEDAFKKATILAEASGRKLTGVNKILEVEDNFGYWEKDYRSYKVNPRNETYEITISASRPNSEITNNLEFIKQKTYSIETSIDVLFVIK